MLFRSCLSEVFLLTALDEVEGYFRKPEVIQSAILGEHFQDNKIRPSIFFQGYYLAVDAKVKGAHVLECSLRDQRGTLLETVDGVDREMTAKER